MMTLKNKLEGEGFIFLTHNSHTTGLELSIAANPGTGEPASFHIYRNRMNGEMTVNEYGGDSVRINLPGEGMFEALAIHLIEIACQLLRDPKIRAMYEEYKKSIGVDAVGV